MGRKKTRVDYRQLYKDYYGIDFDDSMIVHHIDFDRKNNSIENLLLMPRELHAKYHWNISALGGSGNGIIDGNMRISGNTYQVSALKGLADTLDTIMEWFRYKRMLDQMKYSGIRWCDYGRCQVDKDRH